jgi:trigger factor
MEVAVENTSGLERRMTVQVPEEKIAGPVDERLRELMQTARLPGFRPGKVPLKVITRRFSKQVRQEVVGEVLQSTFQDALTENELRPAGGPVIDPISAEPGEGLSYTATFEVYPVLEQTSAEGLEIERPLAAVEESDIDQMLDTLRTQRKEWNDVERGCQEGDRLTIDFVGRIDGEEFPGGKGDDMPLEIGQGGFIPGFEDGLIGAVAGDEKNLDVTFPEEYVENLAGKNAQFTVNVKAVAEPVLPEINEEFVQSLGVDGGTVEALREEVGNNMRRELADALRKRTKDAVMDQLLAANSIDVPGTLVREEQETLFKNRAAELERHGMKPEQLGMNAEMFEDDARRRVALGLLLAELVKAHSLTPDPEKVREAVETVASTFEDPQQVISYYYSDRNRLAEVESSVLEDQIVDMLMDKATVTDKQMSFNDIMERGQPS